MQDQKSIRLKKRIQPIQNRWIAEVRIVEYNPRALFYSFDEYAVLPLKLTCLCLLSDFEQQMDEYKDTRPRIIEVSPEPEGPTKIHGQVLSTQNAINSKVSTSSADIAGPRDGDARISPFRLTTARPACIVSRPSEQVEGCLLIAAT